MCFSTIYGVHVFCLGGFGVHVRVQFTECMRGLCCRSTVRKNEVGLVGIDLIGVWKGGAPQP